MYLDEMRKAVAEAETTLRCADQIVNVMARMISGRLKKGNVSDSTLTELKRELRDWDMHRMTWIDR